MQNMIKATTQRNNASAARFSPKQRNMSAHVMLVIMQTRCVSLKQHHYAILYFGAAGEEDEEGAMKFSL